MKFHLKVARHILPQPVATPIIPWKRLPLFWKNYIKEPFNYISQLFCGLFCGSMEQGFCLVSFLFALRAEWVKLVQEISRWHYWVKKVRCTEVYIMWFHLCKINETKIWTYKYVFKWLCEHRKSTLGYIHQTEHGMVFWYKRKAKTGKAGKKKGGGIFLTKNTKKQHYHVIVKDWTLLN